MDEEKRFKLVCRRCGAISWKEKLPENWEKAEKNGHILDLL